MNNVKPNWLDNNYNDYIEKVIIEVRLFLI